MYVQVSADRLLLLRVSDVARLELLLGRLQRQRGWQHDGRGNPPWASGVDGAGWRGALVVQPCPSARCGSRYLRRALHRRVESAISEARPGVLGPRSDK